jgi:membrane dipeptidase
MKSLQTLAWAGILSAGLGLSIAPPNSFAADQDIPAQTAKAKIPSQGEIDAKAKKIHAKVLTIDSHVDIPSDLMSPAVDPGKRTGMQVDLVKMDEGGLKGAFFIVYMGQTKRDEAGYAKAYAKAMTKFEAIKRMIDAYPDRIGLARSADQARKIAASGRKIAFIGIENGYAIGHDLSRLQAFHGLGARYMTLAHVGHNDIADSSMPRPDLGDQPEEHHGLSEFGRTVVAEMNRVGIMVDVSHIAKSSVMQAIALSRAPVIASHSGARALCDTPRNLDDEQIRAIAAKGGVIQTVAFDNFVRPLAPEKAKAMGEIAKTRMSRLGEDDYAAWSSFEEARAPVDAQFPKPDVAAFVDHIDYLVKVGGIDHVGISSDFGGGGGITGWNDASQTLNITRELVARGYSEQQIAKIWSGNLLRVLGEVEKVSAKMKKAV